MNIPCIHTVIYPVALKFIFT